MKTHLARWISLAPLAVLALLGACQQEDDPRIAEAEAKVLELQTQLAETSAELKRVAAQRNELVEWLADAEDRVKAMELNFKVCQEGCTGGSFAYRDCLARLGRSCEPN